MILHSFLTFYIVLYFFHFFPFYRDSYKCTSFLYNLYIMIIIVLYIGISIGKVRYSPVFIW
jgi:hypothetical protein